MISSSSCLDHRLGDRHEQGCGYTFTGDITDDQADFILADHKEVIEIATDLAGGLQQAMKVELGTSWDIEVGPKTLHAWEVDLCCGIDQAYIEPGGRVVRVNLDTTYTNSDKRYIRLVFPFEEFLLNEDPVLR